MFHITHTHIHIYSMKLFKHHIRNSVVCIFALSLSLSINQTLDCLYECGFIVLCNGATNNDRIYIICRYIYILRPLAIQVLLQTPLYSPKKKTTTAAPIAGTLQAKTLSASLCGIMEHQEAHLLH